MVAPQFGVLAAQPLGRTADGLDDPGDVRATDRYFTAIARNGIDTGGAIRLDKLMIHGKAFTNDPISFAPPGDSGGW